ncbi:hypothetical protein VTN00DRAFT_3965 [Thermoascus crustaceus]|uniref:uncharacterized protein n=1 Tax=Thermoascus crustaceus TaxID=5088 RepID=UPI00374461BE
MAPSEIQALKRRTRRDYPYHLEYRTRWSDNDMYAHLNNSIYAFLIDSIINTYLVSHCGLDPYHHPSSPSPSTPNASPSKPSLWTKPSPPGSGGQIGLVVSSHCSYFSPVSFPDVLDLGLRVTALGSSSATYEVGIFKRGEEAVKAVGGFTHVFVEKGTMRPSRERGMEEGIRRGLERLVVSAGSDSGDGKRGASKL